MSGLRLSSTPVRRRTLGDSPARLSSDSSSRIVRRLAFVTVIVGGLLIGTTSGSASAQTTLASSDPANGAELITSPTQISATFSAAVPNNAVMTMACNSVATPLGSVSIAADAVTLSAPVTGVLPVGTCTVSFSIPETDGKVTFGSFTFEILDPTEAGSGGSSGTNPGATSDGPPVGGPLGLSRLISYAALAALFGGAVLILLYWPEGIDYNETRSYFRIAWILAFVSTYFTAALRAAQVSGESVTSKISPFGWGDLFDNVSDISLVLRVLLVAASALVALRPEGLLDPQSQATSIAFPTLAVLTLAFTRVYDSISIVGIVAGLIHAFAVSIWFGGLLLLVRTVLVGPGDQDLVHAVRGFSRISGPAIVLAAVSGVIQLFHLDGGALLSSRHGRLILFKAVGVVAMFYIGSATRQYIARNLTRRRQLTAKAASKLRSAVMTELLFGIFVLVVTAWSVATMPANVNPPGSDRLTYTFVGDRSGGIFDVQVRITPATVGFNAVRIDVFTPKEGLTDLQVEFTPPTPNSASVTLSVPLGGSGGALLPLAEGIPFGEPGLWTVRVSGNGPEGALPTVTYTVEVTADGLTSLVDPTGSTTASSIVDQTGTTVPTGAANQGGSALPSSTIVTLAPS